MLTKALALITALVLGSCARQSLVPVGPPKPDAVQYAIDHTNYLKAAGCTGVEVAVRVVVTAKHCLEDGAAVNDNFDIHGGVVGYIDQELDFAIIYYPDNKMRVGTFFIPMRDTVIGEHVYVVGYPVQLHNRKQELTVTDGLVAGPVSEDGQVRITAPAYFGNSGGGVWAADGALVGIAVSIYAADLGLDNDRPMPYPGQTFMVPIRHVLKALNEN